LKSEPPYWLEGERSVDMIAHELAMPSSATCIARVRSTPAGEIDLVPGNEDASVYGPVEVAWYPDRLVVTALGAGAASITEAYAAGEAGQDIVVEIRLPHLDELTEGVPGAD
jgi:hypothetical protein